ncbi:hypothetical protein PGN44_15860 [Klebsiella aerogenes]
MTKSTITREQITAWMNDANYALEEPLNADDAAAARAILAMGDELLAAMGSEPVAWMSKGGPVLNGMRQSAHDFAHYNIPLYRHAQPAPVVQDEVTAEDCPALVKCDVTEVDEAWARGFNACRAAMLQAQSSDDGEPTDDECIMAIEGIIPPISAGNSPVIPDGYVMVPRRLTAENGAKWELSGEFSETKFVNCPECFGDDECETCDGSGRIGITVPVTWTTIKEIWAKGVEHFAAAPQEVKGE